MPDFRRPESAICSLSHRRLLVTGLLVQLLRAHFGNPDSIEDDRLRDRLWSDGEVTNAATPPTGKILIEDSSVWKPQLSGQRPAIIVRPNDWTPKKISINNASGNTSEGFVEYTRAYVGSHTVFVIAREGAEAELLADEAYNYLEMFGPQIRPAFHFTMFDTVHKGAPGLVKEAGDYQGVPITVAYAWTRTWVLRQHAPVLKKINFSTLYPSSLDE